MTDSTTSRTSTTSTTHTIDAPTARIVYDVHPGPAGHPVLMLIGSPMDAGGFADLRAYFTDRTVVTYDPRCSGRSVRTDGALQTTPQEHADDLRRVIEAVGGGPVDLFASSGGAVNALELVARHPGLVRTLVAHEPPAASVLPDADMVLAICRDIYDTFQRGGTAPAMAKFIAVTAYAGPFPADYLEQPAPDPAAFGLPPEDDGNRDDPLLSQNMLTCTAYRPDFAALAAASTRVVIAAGKESARQMPGRCAAGIADRLGTEPAMFPSHHGGFMSGEFGMKGEPEAFAARLHEILDA